MTDRSNDGSVWTEVAPALADLVTAYRARQERAEAESSSASSAVVVGRVPRSDLAGEGTSSLDHGVVPSPRLPKDAA